MADTDITKMKVADLKRELKSRGLTTTGNKTELCERLQAAIVDGDAVLDDTALTGDDILEDDVLNDDELDDETKSLLDSTHEDAVLDPIHEDAVLKSPPDSIKSKSPDDQPLMETVTHKKIVLKRKQIIPIPSDSTDPTNDEKVDEPKAKMIKSSADKSDENTINTDNLTNEPSSPTGTDKKLVKLSELSAKERLEMRAKKFGAPATPSSMKNVRAERFGLTNSSTNTSNSSSSNGKTDAPVDVLKKRAERFGGSVSKVMTKIENLEKLQKRRERFGNAITNKNATAVAVTAATNTITTSSPSIDYAEKARLRLEKFKQPVK